MGLLRELWETTKRYFRMKKAAKRFVMMYGGEIELMDQRLAYLGYPEVKYGKIRYKRWNRKQ